ncbi:hypothetical protein BV22DRAFT_1013117 [Leucogyrophana mollusca]|uniref:Uncharacterized protein n=1 Tax=Leucogyrophana mollusca TaxID=85980 RepID=A0ACB8BJ03_9AGAM|nr:hypothetical protein BV22DRAFT_1013117 [Leucogyrophana mollusca]
MGRRSNQLHQAPPSRRSVVNQPHIQAPPAHFYSTSPTSPEDNAHIPPPLAVPVPSPKSPPQSYTPASSYNQLNTYAGQYTMSPQPPMNMVPGNQSYPYTHTHGYHPGVHGSMDSNVLQQNAHAGYQPMMQHLPHPSYPYHPHTPDAPHSSYPSNYSLAHVNGLSPPPHSPLSPQQAGSPHPGSYSGQPAQFHPMRYPSPPSPYTYGPQPFAPSPYQWYYVQGSPVPASYNEGMPMQYQHPYRKPMNYSQPVSHPEVVDSQPRFSRPSQTALSSPPAQSSPGVASQAGRRVIPPSQLGPPNVVNAPGNAPPSSSAAGPSRGSPVASELRSRNVKPVVRRDYHPNPPAHRSEWVMWAGNVPSDTTHDELWRFLKQPMSPRSDASGETVGSPSDGVASIFLISRSNCAFVNYDTADHLHRAILRFNGQQLRPQDTKCPRLVCRARKKEDDLRAGVGGQRGMGVHKRWIKEHRQPESEGEHPSPSSTSDDYRSSFSSSSDRASQAIGPLPPLSSSDEDGAHSPYHDHHSVKARSGSSYASTNSSFLSRYFPRRFFILKSLTQFDLDLSVERGLWATQKHNEAILDQAYRTSQDVFLIFSVNKSGEFYGYAKMTGRILHGERRVSWASRADSSASSLSSLSSAQGRRQEEAIPEEPNGAVPSPGSRGNPQASFFTPSEHRLVGDSPAPFTPSIQSASGIQTAPSSSHQPHPPHHQSAPGALGPLPPREFSITSPASNLSLSERKIRPAATTILKNVAQMPSDDIVLDKNAPLRAVRNKTSSIDESKSPLQPVAEEENVASGSDNEDKSKSAEEPVRQDDGVGARDVSWGETFKIEWICTQRLPFYQTRHLRNAWNHEREIKVSRDGTELEPGVGQQLLEEWKTLADAASGTQDSRPDNMRRRAARSTPALNGPTQEGPS